MKYSSYMHFYLKRLLFVILGRISPPSCVEAGCIACTLVIMLRLVVASFLMCILVGMYVLLIFIELISIRMKMKNLCRRIEILSICKIRLKSGSWVKVN